MNGCRKYEDLIARYLHGETLAQDRKELDNHLAVCPECANLYRNVSDVDRALREYPAKVVEPPPHLHARIIANLPEESPPLWGRWGRWAFGLGSAAVAIVALFFGTQHLGAPPVERVASAPSPTEQSLAPPSSGKGAAVAPRPAEPVRPARAPVLSAVPGGERKRETVVAAAPKVQVIKEVKIFFYFPPAQNVAVTGDFNDWDVDGVPLKVTGKPGLWETELRLPPGVYSYNFIVDGELLVPDPNSPNQMPDGYGGTNSILLVKGEGSI
ncbi:MAG TPA: zf-HC2 domain-containing protein [Candidatus Methanoperedens sp.]|nr:zf-HC2 domain-containing protein [Candidatus Methanoperedens sp.]